MPCEPALRHHLERVLRRAEASEVSYTDGLGTIGTGTFIGHSIVRGAERKVTRTPAPSIAVAPTQSVERNRFIVEKCSELGVVRLQWLATRFGHGRPPRMEKASAWSIAALQQSRGAHLMEICDGERRLGDLVGAVIVADPEGEGPTDLDPGSPVTIVVGPEGGFASNEVPPHLPRWRVSDRVLRTETAAVVAAAMACDLMKRSGRAGHP